MYGVAQQSMVSLETEMPNFFMFVQQQLQNKRFFCYKQVFQQKISLWIWVVAQ